MRRGLWLAAAGAVGLVLLVVLVFRDPPEPDRGASGSAARRAPAEAPDDPPTAGGPTHVPEGSPTEAEERDGGLEPIPGTERWHYQRFLRLAAADPRGFDRVADEKANSAAPLQERVALLRAAWKVRKAGALRWFSAAFAGAAGAQDRDGDAVRGFVLRHLASRARSVPEARTFLEEKVFLDGSVSDRDRSAAGRAVLEAAEPGEIATLLAAIRGISDPAVVEGALVGLARNGHPDAASGLTWLAGNHPQKRVRDRAAELARQRDKGDVDEEDAD